MNRFKNYLAAALFLFFSFSYAQTLKGLPTAKQLPKAVGKSHPRIILTPTSLASIKSNISTNPRMREWHSKFIFDAKALLKEPVSKYEIPDGKRLLETSRRVLNRVQTFSLAYLTTNDDSFLAAAWAELSAAATFQDWNPSHFLDTAELAHAVAIGYDWLYSSLTPVQREYLRKALVDKAFSPAIKAYDSKADWTNATHNWNTVCNSGLAIAALAIADESPEPAGQILHNALNSVTKSLTSYAPDGAWPEGLGYWEYATNYAVALLASLETSIGNDYGLSLAKGLAETSWYPIYLSGPSDLKFTFADMGLNDPFKGSPTFFWFAKKYKQPLLAEVQMKYSDVNTSALNLIWGNDWLASPSAADKLPLEKYFRGPEVVTMRSSWGSKEALFLAFKGGDNTVTHGHLDLGSFVLDAGGLRWFLDLGAEKYSAPNYFGTQRWEYYRARAEGHNTFVMNSGIEADQNPQAKAPVIKVAKHKDGPVGIVDLSKAYEKDVNSAHRGFKLIDGKYVLIQDEILAKKPSKVTWFAHTRHDVVVDPKDPKLAILSSGNAKLMARILSPENARFTVMDAVPLSTSPNPPGQSVNTKIKKLTVSLDVAAGTRISVLMIPMNSADKGVPAFTPAILPLKNW